MYTLIAYQGFESISLRQTTSIGADYRPITIVDPQFDGNSVALSGALTPKIWTDRNGETKPSLDMVAYVVLGAPGTGATLSGGEQLP